MPKYRCKDCANAFDFHHKSLKGEYTLARCPYHEFCILPISQMPCEKFQLKNG